MERFRVVIHQLRIYQIQPALKAEFDERFNKHASRIMETYGFNIVAMWYSVHDDKTEFVYISEWPNVATMTSAWDKFMADKEWEDIKRASREKYGEMVLGKITDQVLEDTGWFKNQLS